jgi:hypothetical protein
MGSPASRPLGMGRLASLARVSGIACTFFPGVRACHRNNRDTPAASGKLSLPCLGFVNGRAGGSKGEQSARDMGAKEKGLGVLALPAQSAFNALRRE